MKSGAFEYSLALTQSQAYWATLTTGRFNLTSLTQSTLQRGKLQTWQQELHTNFTEITNGRMMIFRSLQGDPASDNQFAADAQHRSSGGKVRIVSVKLSSFIQLFSIRVVQLDSNPLYHTHLIQATLAHSIEHSPLTESLLAWRFTDINNLSLSEPSLT